MAKTNNELPEGQRHLHEAAVSVGHSINLMVTVLVMLKQYGQNIPAILVALTHALAYDVVAREEARSNKSLSQEDIQTIFSSVQLAVESSYAVVWGDFSPETKMLMDGVSASFEKDRYLTKEVGEKIEVAKQLLLINSQFTGQGGEPA